jgi:hypothetical protein
VSPLEIGWIVFACVLGGTLLGMFLRGVLPDHHLSPESKSVIQLGIGMIATMTALILGLMTSSAKSGFDTKATAIEHLASDLTSLDGMLAGYGAETEDIRAMLRGAVALRLETSWPEESGRVGRGDKPEAAAQSDQIAARVLALTPKTDAQRWYQSQALGLVSDVLQTRWTVFVATGSSVPLPFLVVVVSWLTVIFASFGLFAPRNATVLVVLFACALSVAASVFLILEMEQPFSGMMKVSSAPLRYTLTQIGK